MGNCPHCKTGTIVKDNWYPQWAVQCPLCGWYGEVNEDPPPVPLDMKGAVKHRESGRKSVSGRKREGGRFVKEEAA